MKKERKVLRMTLRRMKSQKMMRRRQMTWLAKLGVKGIRKTMNLVMKRMSMLE